MVEPLSAALPVVPLAGAELDAVEPGAVDPDVLALGLVVLVGDGAGVVGAQLVPVPAAGSLLALPLAGAETVVVVGLAELVRVGVAVFVLCVADALSEVTLLAGVLLVLPLDGVVAGLAGVTLGVTDFFALTAADDEELDAHGLAVSSLGPMELAASLRPPFDEPSWLPDPAGLPAPLSVLCEEVIPTTAEPSW